MPDDKTPPSEGPPRVHVAEDGFVHVPLFTYGTPIPLDTIQGMRIEHRTHDEITVTMPSGLSPTEVAARLYALHPTRYTELSMGPDPVPYDPGTLRSEAGIPLGPEALETVRAAIAAGLPMTFNNGVVAAVPVQPAPRQQIDYTPISSSWPGADATDSMTADANIGEESARRYEARRARVDLLLELILQDDLDATIVEMVARALATYTYGLDTTLEKMIELAPKPHVDLPGPPGRPAWVRIAEGAGLRNGGRG